MKQERIDRINTLYHKSQAVGLTEEEKKEQAALRKEYIESIRGNMRGQLNSILIKEKDGSITDGVHLKQRLPARNMDTDIRPVPASKRRDPQNIPVSSEA